MHSNYERKRDGSIAQWMRRVVINKFLSFCNESQSLPLISNSVISLHIYVACNTDKYFNKLNIAQTVIRKCYYDREDDSIDHW